MFWHGHDGVIKWKHFSRYLSFVRGVHQSQVDSPNKGQKRRALVFSFICAWISGWGNNRDAGDLRRNRLHYDVTVMEAVQIHWLKPLILIWLWKSYFKYLMNDANWNMNGQSVVLYFDYTLLFWLIKICRLIPSLFHKCFPIFNYQQTFVITRRVFLVEIRRSYFVMRIRILVRRRLYFKTIHCSWRDDLSKSRDIIGLCFILSASYMLYTLGHCRTVSTQQW